MLLFRQRTQGEISAQTGSISLPAESDQGFAVALDLRSARFRLAF